MADKKLYYDKIYGLVMQCRKGGLSDKQWCINNDIAPSTFYWWIKKLRQQACYEIPEHSFKCNTNIVTEKQDVVCVNVLPEVAENITLFAEENDTQAAPIMFKYKNASITLQDDFNEQLDYMKRKLFGSSCEKIELQTDGQLSFNFSDETTEELPVVEEEIIVKKHTRKKKLLLLRKQKIFRLKSERLL